MATETARLDLVKPDYVDSADVAVINANMDTIDGAVGVSIVNTVADITEPFNGQFAYELDFKLLHFFINGEWLLVAAGDQNSGNPNRIRLPAGDLSSLDDTENAFQIGADGAPNLAMDDNDIQARNNEAAAALKVNPLGGDVEIGDQEEAVFTMSNDGMEISKMDSVEDGDSANISVNQQSYYIGGSPADISCIAPPSGKVKVTALCSMTTAGSGHVGYFAFVVHKVSDGSVFLNDGGDGREAILMGNVRAVMTVVDVVKGMTPGTNYRFRTSQKRGASGDNVDIQWRKIIVEPVY